MRRLADSSQDELSGRQAEETGCSRKVYSLKNLPSCGVRLYSLMFGVLY